MTVDTVGLINGTIGPTMVPMASTFSQMVPLAPMVPLVNFPMVPLGEPRTETMFKALVHLPLLLEVPGSIPAAGEESLVSDHTSLRVICRDDMNTGRRTSDRDVNWRPPVQGDSPLMQVKEPYIGNLNGCILQKKHRGVQYTTEIMIRN